MAKNESKEKQPFPDDVCKKVLLWCDHHCCLCKKQCGPLMEIHHIDGVSAEIDNAMPVCFECHGIIGHYNPQHPKGKKFRREELKDRRNQVYDEFTRHLVPQIHYEICKHSQPFPEVAFALSHKGRSLPVQVKVELKLRCDTRRVAIPTEQRFYSGNQFWNLNPGLTLAGHFTLPKQVVESSKVEIQVTVSIVDKYGYEHRWLPVSWQYRKRVDADYWFLNPSPSPEFSKARRKSKSKK